MSITIQSAQSIFPDTQVASVVANTSERFNKLNAEDQLALIWFAYTEMGKTITVAATGATSMIFAQKLLDQIKQMTPAEQTQVMCDLANQTDSPNCRSYGSFTTNLKLGFWNQLGEWMEQGIVAPIPQDYQLSSRANFVLQEIANATPGEQITILRNAVVNMGFDSNSSGNRQKVREPIAVPTTIAARTLARLEILGNELSLRSESLSIQFEELLCQREKAIENLKNQKNKRMGLRNKRKIPRDMMSHSLASAKYQLLQVWICH